MAKIILSGKIYKSLLNFTADAILLIVGDAEFTDDGSGFMQGATYNTESPVEIILKNDHHLIMYKMESSYLITYDITNGSLILNSVAPNTSVCIKLLNNNYKFSNLNEANEDDDGFVSFGNVNKFLEICETVDSFFANGYPVIGSDDLPLEKICFLRDYQELDKMAVTLFMQQNGKVPAIVIDSFIDNNFFALDRITKSLVGSDLDSKGPYNVLDEIRSHICSNLKLEDVNIELAGANVDNIDNNEA